MLFKAGLANDGVMKGLEKYLDELRQKSVKAMIMRIEGRMIGAREQPSSGAATIADYDQVDCEGGPAKPTFFWQQQQQQQPITAHARQYASPEQVTKVETKKRQAQCLWILLLPGLRDDKRS